MDFTRPDVSTSASSVTLSPLPAAKSCNAFGEAIARTDLINFGGTIATPSEGGTAETIAALLNVGGADRFLTEAAISGFSSTVATSAASFGADLAAPGVSVTAGAEGLAVSNALGCDASRNAAPGAAVGASLV